MLLESNELFKQKIDERIAIGKQFIDTAPPVIGFDKWLSEFDGWNDYNYEYLKQAFENPENEYRISYGDAGFGYFGDALSQHPKGSALAIQDLARYKLDDLRKLSNKAELIKSKIPTVIQKQKTSSKIFIGHGRNKIWARLKIYLKEDLNLETLAFEDESRTSENIINILEDFLETSAFAILIMTAEDETSDGKNRARQNVIHEAGLFQGRLGFNNVIILKQDGIEEFSNIAGLQYIPFSSDNIEQTFYELHRKLKKLGLAK